MLILEGLDGLLFDHVGGGEHQAAHLGELVQGTRLGHRLDEWHEEGVLGHVHGLALGRLKALPRLALS